MLKMSIRKSFGRRKVYHKSTSKRPRSELTSSLQDPNFFLHRAPICNKLTSACFGLLVETCEKMYLIPFTRSNCGTLLPRTRPGLVCHYTALTLGATVAIYKVYATAAFMMAHEVQLETVMCASLSLVYTISILLSTGMIMNPKETTDLYSSWSLILHCLKGKTAGNLGNLTAFNDGPTCVKVMCAFVAAQGVAICASLLNLIFTALPASWFTTVEALGLIPAAVVETWPRLAWQLLFFPLEFVTYLLPVLCAALSASFLILSTGVLKIYTDELRCISSPVSLPCTIVEKIIN